jgi:hypothetical protein
VIHGKPKTWGIHDKRVCQNVTKKNGRKLQMLLDAPRYRKHPALIAPRTLLAVSEDVVTDAPTITPTKLVQATAKTNTR